MIFNFLRQYLKDEEFEQTKIELAETRQILKEYKEFLTQLQNKGDQRERNEVDPSFLALMWASIGVGLSIFVSAGKKAVSLKDQLQTHCEPWIWLALALFSFYFIFDNGRYVLALTKKYVQTKDDPIYKNYSRYLTMGVILIVSAAFALAFLK